MAKIKKAQNGAKTAVKKKTGPTYKNLRMGVNADNKAAGSSFEQKPTKADSASYRSGYERGMAGKGPDPAETNTSRMGRWEGQNAKKASAPKKKMQAGGVMKPTKRVGPVDPNGAFTKVQERTIAGKKAPKVPLKKNTPLGATKMKKGGSIKKK
jgi:hypothetical protein